MKANLYWDSLTGLIPITVVPVGRMVARVGARGGSTVSYDRVERAADESRRHNITTKLQADDLEHLEDVLDALQALAARGGLESECAYQHPGAGECWAYDPASPAPSTEWRVSVSASNVE